MEKFKKIKIKSVKELTIREKTYDLSIDGSHHYILKNGVISHNSMDLFPQAIQSGGESLNYLASTIVLLSKAKLEDKDRDEMSTGSIGSTITALARKNRLAKPKKIKFEIDHSKGCNPYKGLDQFCTVENFDKVGIAKVKPVVDKKTGEITYENGSKWYVKHMDKTLFESQLYNGKVFTMEVLEALEPIIYEYFRYASYDEYQEEMQALDEQYASFEQDADFEIDDESMDNKLFG